MIFTSFSYIIFLLLILFLYWLTPNKCWRNVYLLIGSYVFYGWIHPWFCILIAVSTLVDYACGIGIGQYPGRKKWFLLISLLVNLGMLGAFKYFNFFIDNITALLEGAGWHVHGPSMRIFLPVGISFYTFQTLSYTIDVYRGEMEPRRNFLDVAVFVALFPQLVAGPIERAKHLLPQIECRQKWSWDYFHFAWPLLIRGYLKKLVIADQIAVVVDKIFMLQHPPLALLCVGTLAFSLQIYADFSAYTDIARASAKLLGFDLMENFKSPYLAISPSDFWRRWHISFSTWIRDYLYIPLGGSRVKTRLGYFLVVMTTMGLSGLWHGAAWNFVLWGFYHGALLYTYSIVGLAGRWQPKNRWYMLAAWLFMFVLVQFGWLLFRTQDMSWLYVALKQGVWVGETDVWVAALVALLTVCVFSAPLFCLFILDRYYARVFWLRAVVYGGIIVLITCLHQPSGGDFIYFQF